MPKIQKLACQPNQLSMKPAKLNPSIGATAMPIVTYAICCPLSEVLIVVSRTIARETTMHAAAVACRARRMKKTIVLVTNGTKMVTKINTIKDQSSYLMNAGFNSETKHFHQLNKAL